MKTARLAATVLALAVAGLARPVQAQPAKPDYKLLVAHRNDGTVGVFQPVYGTIELVKTIPTGKGAREISVTADGKRAYVSNKDDHSISVLDLDALAVTKTITDPRLKDPEGLQLSKDGQKLYAALSSRNVIAVLSTDTHEVVKEIATG